MLLEAIQEKHGRYLSTLNKIVVGVSGGADSLALLHALKTLLGSERLVVAHLDHGWRDASRADAEFVRQTAVSWHIPYHSKRLPPTTQHSNLEASGRQARYQFFAEVAQCEGVTHIAVGHHQDDQVETILMHLLRGSGLTGLRGMSFETPLFGHSELLLIRPLLNTSRKMIEQYCQENQLIPRQDETNSDPNFQRNRLRHELLPLLHTYNNQLSDHLLQLANIISSDDDLLKKMTQESLQRMLVDSGVGWLTLNRSAWQALPIALQRRLLRTAVSTLTPTLTDIGFRSVEAARLGLENGRFGQSFHLPSGITAIVQADTLLFILPDTTFKYDLPLLGEKAAHTIDMSSKTELANGWFLECAVVNTPNYDGLFEKELVWEAYLPCVDVPITLRTRVAGDKIRPLGMNGRSRKIKKMMSENHIPRTLRDHWPILLIDQEIVWVPGIVRSHSFIVQGDEDQLIHLRIAKN